VFDVLARLKLIHVPDDSILPQLRNDKVPKEDIRLSRASAISRSLFSLRSHRPPPKAVLGCV
jgi:hypothetical protein